MFYNASCMDRCIILLEYKAPSSQLFSFLNNRFLDNLYILFWIHFCWAKYFLLKNIFSFHESWKWYRNPSGPSRLNCFSSLKVTFFHILPYGTGSEAYFFLLALWVLERWGFSLFKWMGFCKMRWTFLIFFWTPACSQISASSWRLDAWRKIARCSLVVVTLDLRLLLFWP